MSTIKRVEIPVLMLAAEVQTILIKERRKPVGYPLYPGYSKEPVYLTEYYDYTKERWTESLTMVVANHVMRCFERSIFDFVKTNITNEQ